MRAAPRAQLTRAPPSNCLGQVSLGRQPYTDESAGQLLVRLSADAFPAARSLGSPMATLRLQRAGTQHALPLTGLAPRRGGECSNRPYSREVTQAWGRVN
jgi:hypothetical protein